MTSNAFAYFRNQTTRRVIAVLAVWSLLGTIPLSVLALPQGGRVGSGNVSWESVGNTMTVNQLSSRAIVNWNSFSIGGLETVQFLQPNANASILNRVTGPYSSEIFGSLLANGNVYLINPNGILFGAGARINVGGLVASTFDLSDADFNAGRLHFKNLANAGGVANYGNISAAAFAYLIGARVENHGSITAPAVALAAGRDKIVIDRTATGGEIRLSVDADMAPIVFTAFDDPQAMANVVNTGVIDASGASGGDVALQGENIVQSGTIRADGIVGDGGRVSLLGERLVSLASDSVTTANAGLNGTGGRIDLVSKNYLGVYERAAIAARGGSLSGNGGFVETSGYNSFVIDAAPDVGAANGRGGEWLIDPYDITIVSAPDFGGIWDPWPTDLFAMLDNTTIAVSTLLAGLEQGDVSIHTVSPGTQAGNITVNADVIYDASLYAGNTLTLDADNDIYLNAIIKAGADNGLGLVAGGDVTQAAGRYVQVGTVLFDVDGSVTMETAENRIGTLTGTVGGDLTLVNDITLDLDGLRVADGATTLTVNGDLTNTGANTLKDVTAITAGDILLTTANDFGEVTANANNGTGRIELRDAAGALGDTGIILRDIDGGTLKVTADDGSITQKSGTRVEIVGASDLTAAEQIILFNEGNDFGGPVSARAKGIQLRDRNNIILDLVRAGADGLTVQTDDGAITQTDGFSAYVTVLGETHLLARNADTSPADITLDNDLNDFVGAVHADGANIKLVDRDDILLGRIDAMGDLIVHANDGSITQTGDGVYALDETWLVAAGDIILTTMLNDFVYGPVHADGKNIALTDANNIHLGRIVARGTLDVTALDGDITQNPAGVSVSGVATFTAEGNDIVLGSEQNRFGDTVNAYGNDILLTSGADGIRLGRVKALADADDETAAGTVIITALNGNGSPDGAAITDAQQEAVGHDAEGFATMTGPRTVNIIANDLLLVAEGDIGEAGTPLDISAGTLAAWADGSIWLFETDALTIGTVAGVSGITAGEHAKIETLSGTLTVDNNVRAGSDILLAANGAGSDVVLNRLVMADRDLTVLAAQDVWQNSLLLARESVVVEAKAGTVIMSGLAMALAGGGILYRADSDIALTTLIGGNVRVEAGGDITDAYLNNLPNIIANNAQLVAGGSVGGAGGTASDANIQAVNTLVGTLAAEATGDVYVRNAGGTLTIGDVATIGVNRVALDSTTTPLDVGALSGVTAGGNAKIVSVNGDFNVDAAVTATSGDLLLWAQGGALNVGANLTAGDLLTLRGNGLALDANLVAQGDLFLDAGTGNIAGTYTIEAGSARLTADGDIALDRITASDAVSVVAGGNITDANRNTAANITANRVRLEAGRSIGAGNGRQTDWNPRAVDIVANFVEALANGHVYLQAGGALTVGGVGDVNISYARFNSGRTTTTDADLTGITAVNGVAKVRAGSLAVEEAVWAGTDALLLTTVGPLTLNAVLNAGRHATLTAAGTLFQNADITAGGDIFLSGASILTGSGVALHGANVRYASVGNTEIGFITADGLVNIVAGGDIIDANHDNSANIVANAIRLEAGGSIGALGDELDIEAADIVAVLAGGEAHLRSEGTITIGAMDEIETRYARFSSGVSVVVDPPLAGFTTGGNASLTSVNGDIRQTTDSIVDIGGRSWLEALNGDIRLENAGNDFRGRVDATARNVYLRDKNDLFVGLIEATHGGHVRLTAGDDISNARNWTRLNVVGGSAEFYAGQDIGSPLYIDVGTLVEARAGRDIRLTQVAGNMNIDRQVYAGRDVVLDVWHGGIVDLDNDGYVRPWLVTPDNADIYSGGTMTLIADFVGTLRNPVEIISGWGLWLDSHRPPAPPNGTFPWVVVNGDVGGGRRNIHVDPNGVPGLVLYNGQIIWGPWWTVRQFQLAQRSLADNEQPSLLQTGIAKLPWFLQPDLSLLSPAAVRDDLREAEQKVITGAEEEIPEDQPRTKRIGLPVSTIGL